MLYLKLNAALRADKEVVHGTYELSRCALQREPNDNGPYRGLIGSDPSDTTVAP